MHIVAPYIAFCLLFGTLHVSAQEKSRTRFYVLTAADYQVNGWDVDFTPDPDGVAIGEQPVQNGILRCKSNVGGRFGIGVMRRSKYGFLLDLGFDFKVVPQKVSLLYNAAENGYQGSSYTYKKDFSFTEFSVDYKVSLGYSLPIVHDKGALELTTGIVLDLPLSGKDNGNGEIVYGQPRNSANNDLIMFHQDAWGSSPPYKDIATVDINIFCHLQLAYRFMPGTVFKDRALRAGFDLFGASAGDHRGEVSVTTYGPNRAYSTKQNFVDNKTSLGLFVAMEL